MPQGQRRRMTDTPTATTGRVGRVGEFTFSTALSTTRSRFARATTIRSHFGSSRLRQPSSAMPSTVCAFALLEFHRSPRAFREALQGPGLHHVRHSLETIGHTMYLESGAKLVVAPEDAKTVLNHMAASGVPLGERRMYLQDLKPRHILVDIDYEDDLLGMLRRSQGSGKNGGICRDNIRVKQRQVVMLF